MHFLKSCSTFQAFNTINRVQLKLKYLIHIISLKKKKKQKSYDEYFLLCLNNRWKPDPAHGFYTDFWQIDWQ